MTMIATMIARRRRRQARDHSPGHRVIVMALQMAPVYGVSLATFSGGVTSSPRGNAVRMPVSMAFGLRRHVRPSPGGHRAQAKLQDCEPWRALRGMTTPLTLRAG